MKKLIKYSGILWSIVLTLLVVQSCKKFLNPIQESKPTQDELFNDWYEYRSVEMGLYALQQKLVEQLMVLGELRGDLLTVTPNADADLVEINNFNVSKPTNMLHPPIFTNLFQRVIILYGY